MDERQIIIYILLLAFYLLSRALKPKKKPLIPPEKNSSDFGGEEGDIPDKIPHPYEEVTEKPRPVTFEDLLKEFTGYKEEETPDIPPVTYQKKDLEPEKQDDRYTGQPEPIYVLDSDNEMTVRDPEKPAGHFSYDDLYHGPEKMTQSDIRLKDVNLGRFGQYASYKTYDIHKAGRFRALLHNPLTVKDAVIMKEILDRKYF